MPVFLTSILSAATAAFGASKRGGSQIGSDPDPSSFAARAERQTQFLAWHFACDHGRTFARRVLTRCDPFHTRSRLGALSLCRHGALVLQAGPSTLWLGHRNGPMSRKSRIQDSERHRLIRC